MCAVVFEIAYPIVGRAEFNVAFGASIELTSGMVIGVCMAKAARTIR